MVIKLVKRGAELKISNEKKEKKKVLQGEKATLLPKKKKGQT